MVVRVEEGGQVEGLRWQIQVMGYMVGHWLQYLAGDAFLLWFWGKEVGDNICI